MASPKRIPVGTRVQFRARYPSDPLNEGVVTAFVAKGQRYPNYSWMTATQDIYIVSVDRTPTGRPRKSAKVMTPPASRLERQNPKALE